MIADLSCHNGELDWNMARNALDFATFCASWAQKFSLCKAVEIWLS